MACVRVPDGAGGRRQEVRTYPTFSSGLESLAEWLARPRRHPGRAGGDRPVLEADLVCAGGAWAASCCWSKTRPGQAGARPQVGRQRCRVDRSSCCSAGCSAAASCRDGSVPRAAGPDPLACPVGAARDRRGWPTASTRPSRTANIKLGAVASDILGKSGRAMLRALIRGEHDPEETGGAGAKGGCAPRSPS